MLSAKCLPVMLLAFLGASVAADVRPDAANLAAMVGANDLLARRNGGFEMPLVTHASGKTEPVYWHCWTADFSVALETGDVHEGKQAIRFSSPEGGFLHGDALPLTSQTPGPIYVEAACRLIDPEARASLGAQRSERCGVQIIAQWTDGRATAITPIAAAFDPTAAGWQKLAFVWTPPKPVKAVSVRLTHMAPGEVLFDAVKAVEITEELKAAGFTPRAEPLPLNLHETFEGAAVPAAFTPHAGAWTVRDGALTPASPLPPGGAYIRTANLYDLPRFSLRLRRPERGVVMLYSQDLWITLQPERITVKRARGWGSYRNSIARPIDFTPDQWHELRIDLDGPLTARFDGQEVLRWESAEAEWGERIRKSGKFAAPLPELPDEPMRFAANHRFLIIHALYAPVAVDDVKLWGLRRRNADYVFRNPDALPPQPVARLDSDLDRLAPLTPVDVNWRLPAEQQKIAAALPAVKQWDIPKGAFRKIGEFIDAGKRSEPVVYRVGASGEQQFPNTLWGPRGWPTGAQVHFHLESPGEYTLKAEWGAYGLGWGPNVLEVRVDGKPVSREIYRGGCQASGHCSGRDYIPLKLAAGPHRIDFVSSGAQFIRLSYMCKYMKCALHSVALVPGVHEPVFTRKTHGKPHRWHNIFGLRTDALADSPTIGEQYGKIVRYRIGPCLPGQTYAVTLGFYEVDVQRVGKRLMDLYLNGKRIEEDLDVCERIGWMKYGELTYRVAAQPETSPARNGESEQPRHVIDLKLVGKNFKAFVNCIKVTDADGNTVFQENCGWHPFIRAATHHGAYYQPQIVKPRAPLPTTRAPEDLYDGHDLVPNGHFHLAEEDKPEKPLKWYAGSEYPARHSRHGAVLSHYKLLTGEGAYALDPEVGRNLPGSLRVGRTRAAFGMIFDPVRTDYGKRQRFTFHAKTDKAAGKVYGEILWFAGASLDNDHRGAPDLRLLGRSRSRQTVTGTADWTAIAVEDRPPFGANRAICVVGVDNNTAGDVWIDDASMNGYGVEPLEITISHVGYHPLSDKQIVVRSFAKAPVQWELREANAGKPVRDGQARPHSYEWASRRHYYRFDLTGFSQPGRYVLAVRQGAQQVESEPFNVDRDVYRDLSRICLDGLTGKRFNANLHDVQVPEAMEYARASATVRRLPRFCVYEPRFLPGRRNALGGYYDAGDQIKIMHYWCPVLLGVANLYTLVGSDLRGKLGATAREELVWAFEGMCRMQHESGSFYTLGEPQAPILDNIPFYQGEAYVTRPNPLPQAAGILAMGAELLADVDADLAARCLAAALKNYELNWDKRRRQIKDPTPVIGFHYASKFLLAEVYLSKLTGAPQYAERMAAHARLLAEGLREKLYANSWEMVQPPSFAGGVVQDFFWAPVVFCERAPEHPARAAVLDGLRAFADEVARVSAESPWGQARDVSIPPGEPPRRYPGDHLRPFCYWPALAHGLARLGMLLKDADMIRLAERQLQWMCGKNFADISTVHGAGERVFAGGDHLFDKAEWFAAFLDSDKKRMHYDGCVPTLCFRDLRPDGYCRLYLQPDFPIHPAPTEYWLPQTAHMTIAAPAVHAALASLEVRQ